MSQDKGSNLESRMKSLITALAVTTALTAPGALAAKTVTFTTKLNDYGGQGAYLAFYVTDQNGGYVGTLWLAGGRARYFEHLSGWYRASGGNMSGLDGLTGASVGSGQTLTLALEVADTVIDAGYTLHIDAAAEHMRSVASDVSIPLTSAGAGQTVHGKGYVADFSYSM
jgi:hypothetical protein